MRMSSSGLQTLGSVITGSAVTLWAGFWIYAMQSPSAAVNSWPTWTLAAVATLGVIILVVGARRTSDPPNVTLSQHGGSNSLNVQSGRDAFVEFGDKGV